MMNAFNASAIARSENIGPKYLGFLTLSYTMVIVLANWFNPRMISIFGLNTGSGALLFPLTFMLSDMITEVYGYKKARRAIWCGFFFNIVFLLYSKFVTYLPSPDFATNNAHFDKLLDLDARIIIASIISYLITEPCNSYLLAKMKIKMRGNLMGIRFLVSTLFATGLDSIIFPIIAFYGILSNIIVIEIMITVWFIKVVIELMGLPFTIRLAKKLKVIEKSDVYDINTQFSVLSFDDHYSSKDNEFDSTFIGSNQSEK